MRNLDHLRPCLVSLPFEASQFRLSKGTRFYRLHSTRMEVAPLCEVAASTDAATNRNVGCPQTHALGHSSLTQYSAKVPGEIKWPTKGITCHAARLYTLKCRATLGCTVRMRYFLGTGLSTSRDPSSLTLREVFKGLRSTCPSSAMMAGMPEGESRRSYVHGSFANSRFADEKSL